jgi:hypothetical protein
MKEPITDERIKTVCDILYTLDSNDEIMDQGVAAVRIIESLQAKVAEQSGELDRMEVARLHAIEKRIRLADKLAEAEDALRSTDITVENARTKLAEAEKLSADYPRTVSLLVAANDKLAEAEAKIERVEVVSDMLGVMVAYSEGARIGRLLQAALADTEETK